MFSSILGSRSNNGNGPVLENASEIPVLAVVWLWQFWLARGKLHILAGPPSTGKTTLALQVAATLTHGGKWPDGSQAPMGRVVIWTCEDGIEDTIMPRLIACGVDSSRVYILRVTKENNRTRAFDFNRDLLPLEAKVRELDDVALVIIDSIVQVVTGNSNNNSQVRKDLDPLVKFAERTNCAILGLTHVNKGSKKKDPLERVNGSTAIGALARVVWIVARDANNRAGDGVQSCVLVRVKSNLGPTEGGFAYHVEGVDVPIDAFNITHSSKVAWDDQLQGSPKEILDEAEGGRASACDDRKQEAMSFLGSLLANGPLPVETVQQKSGQAGMAWATVRRAADALRVKKYRPMGDVKWYWALENGSTRGWENPPGQTGSPGAPWAPNMTDGPMSGSAPPVHNPSDIFAANAGLLLGWAKPSRQHAVAEVSSMRENVEQVEQHEQVASAVDDIDGGMWTFMVAECLKKYQASPQPDDPNEHAELRESIVDTILDVNVEINDAVWKARAKSALLNADFWFA
jgi:hypothetical protein